MSATDWVMIILSIGMVLFIVGVLIERIRTKFGMSLNLLRFIAIVLLVPITAILGISKTISSDAVATLLGAVAGYILANIEKREKTQ